MGKQGIYKFNADCGRQGYLEGVFVATDEEVKVLVDEKIEVYFGEVLGKHSEVYGKIENNEIEFITDDKKVVDLFNEYDLSNGYNPFEYDVIHLDYDKYDLDEDVEYSVMNLVKHIIKTQNVDK